MKPFIASVLLNALLLAAQCAMASDRVRILVLETMPVDVVLSLSRETREHLAELGWRDGETAEIVVLRAEGSRDLAEEHLRAAAEEQMPDLLPWL